MFPCWSSVGSFGWNQGDLILKNVACHQGIIWQGKNIVYRLYTCRRRRFSFIFSTDLADQVDFLCTETLTDTACRTHQANSTTRGQVLPLSQREQGYLKHTTYNAEIRQLCQKKTLYGCV